MQRLEKMTTRELPRTPRSIASGFAGASTFLLDRRARDRAVAAKDPALAALGPQHRAASFAKVEADARISGHRFGGLMAAMPAGDGRTKF